jgi:hypothetical protein
MTRLRAAIGAAVVLTGVVAVASCGASSAAATRCSPSKNGAKICESDHIANDYISVSGYGWKPDSLVVVGLSPQERVVTASGAGTFAGVTFRTSGQTGGVAAGTSVQNIKVSLAIQPKD